MRIDHSDQGALDATHSILARGPVESMVTAAFTLSIVPDGDLGANVAGYARQLRAANLSPMT